MKRMPRRMLRYVLLIATRMAALPMRRLWIAMAVVSWMGVSDLSSGQLMDCSTTTGVILTASMAMLKAWFLVALVVIANQRRWSRIMAGVALAAYSMVCVVNFVSWHLYGFGIGHRLLTIASQTYGDEIRDFIPSLIENLGAMITQPALIVVAAVIAVAVWAIKYFRSKAWIATVTALAFAGLVTTIYQGATLPKGRNLLMMSVRLPKTIVETRHEISRLNDDLASLRDLPDPASVSSTHAAANVIVVLGESASRDHWSLYGYPLPTTPEVDSMRDSLTIFTDAVGSSTSTAPNMERLLTLKTDADNAPWYDYPLLFDIFNRAGYHTCWFSNQERVGLWSNSSGAMASRASEVRYLGSYSSEDPLENRYDEVVLPVLHHALATNDSLRFIGLHLMGSHTEYRHRYPADRSAITPEAVVSTLPRPWLSRKKAATVAQYDNSIRYTDSIVGQIISLAASTSAPTLVVYLSDHGENVYDTRNFRGRDPEHASVPMIVYANKSYRQANPELIGQLKRASSKKISTSSLPMMLMSLTGTRYSGYRDASDPMADGFVERSRYIDGEPYETTTRQSAI